MLQSLFIGVSGLTTAQRAIEVTSHNLANVNTPGYSRQRAELVTSRPIPGAFGLRGSGMKGSGVTVADVVRIRSQFGDTTFRAEMANGQGWDARAEILGRAESVLGDFDSGAPGALNAFWASWDALSLDPQSTAARQNVLDRAAALADNLNAAHRRLSELVTDTNARIRDDVDEVNRLSAEIASLNGRIKDGTIANNSVNDLLDRRDLLIDELAGLTGANVRPTDFNQVTITIGSVAVVREETATALAASPTNPPTITVAGDTIVATPAGALGARLEAVHDTLPGLQSALDDIANGIKDLVNTQHTAGFDQDGNAGLDFFTGTGASDLAVNTAVGARQVAASAGGEANDPNNAVAMSGLRSAAAVGGASAIDAIAAFGARIGGLARQAIDASESSQVVTQNLSRERSSVSGVSIDEELTDLIRFQRAFEASARVITTVDQMLDVLVNRTGLAGR